MYDEDFSNGELNIYRCSEETRKPDDPECADPEQIDQFLKTKVFSLSVLDTKMDFSSWEKRPVRQYMKDSFNARLKGGLYTDSKVKLR